MEEHEVIKVIETLAPSLRRTVKEIMFGELWVATTEEFNHHELQIALFVIPGNRDHQEQTVVLTLVSEGQFMLLIDPPLVAKPNCLTLAQKQDTWQFLHLLSEYYQAGGTAVVV